MLFGSFHVGHIELRCDASPASQPRCISKKPFHRECSRMGHALHELQCRYGTEEVGRFPSSDAELHAHITFARFHALIKNNMIQRITSAFSASKAQ